MEKNLLRGHGIQETKQEVTSVVSYKIWQENSKSYLSENTKALIRMCWTLVARVDFNAADQARVTLG